jgi:hypothetical protein
MQFAIFFLSTATAIFEAFQGLWTSMANTHLCITVPDEDKTASNERTVDPYVNGFAFRSPWIDSRNYQ